MVACHCTDLYLFNLFVHLASKLSLSLSAWLDLEYRDYAVKYRITSNETHNDN